MPGLLRVVSNSDLAQQEREQAQVIQNTPLVQNLSGYLRSCWSIVQLNRTELETRMLKCLRQRAGEYEPALKAKLEAQGGNPLIFMMLTDTKCRAAESWIRDLLLSTGKLPWGIEPSSVPSLSPEEMQGIMTAMGREVAQLVATHGIVPSQDQLDQLKDYIVRKVRTERMEEAREAADGMQLEMEDQLEAGGVARAVHEFISDLVTYPFAVIKGPTIQRQMQMSWKRDIISNMMLPNLEETFAPTFSRVSPFNFYFEAGIDNLDKGFCFEVHDMTRGELSALKGLPGYDDGAISNALLDYDNGALNDWLTLVSHNKLTQMELESRAVTFTDSPHPTFNALEFWGRVSGRLLVEWGMTEEEVPDEDKEYEITCWQVGRWVIRAVLNYDTLMEKPYHLTSYIKVPGGLIGKGIPETMADVQSVCNAAARALVANMAVAAGPQVELYTDRLAQNESITELYPWRIWQMVSDPLGTTQRAINFTQPDMHAAELLGIYEKFSRIADEVTSIPAYIYGDTDIQGAGRTASGLSMLMGSAGKGIRQIITYIDLDVLRPLLRQLYRWNMKYNENNDIKGDADIVPKAMAAIIKEQLNMRRVEFLQATANPIDAQIIGPKGRAAILREVAKGLEMDVDEIIPSAEDLAVQQKIMQAQQLAAMAPQTQQLDVMRDDTGQMTGLSMRAPSARPAAATMDQNGRSTT